MFNCQICNTSQSWVRCGLYCKGIQLTSSSRADRGLARGLRGGGDAGRGLVAAGGGGGGVHHQWQGIGLLLNDKMTV